MRWATQEDELEEGDTLKLAVAGALDAGTYTVRFDNGSGSVYAIEVAVSEGATYIFIDTGDLGDDASGNFDIDLVDDSGSSLLDSGAASVNISQRLYLHYGLHSPVVATNSDGETVWRRAYLPFGGDFAGSPYRPITINNDAITHGFVGRRSDNDVGLYQLGARWYDPDLGRFMSVDPVPGFINQYAYANNNPIRYHDANGRSVVVLVWMLATSENETANELGNCISAAAAGELEGGKDFIVGTVTSLGEAETYYKPGALRIAESGYEVYKNREQIKDDFLNKDSVGQAKDIGRVFGAAGGAILLTKATKDLSEFAQKKAPGIKDLPPLRQQYVDEVKGLRNKIPNMRKAGMSSEEIARKLHAERRNLGIKYKDMTPPEELERITARNIRDCGDPLGPTIDHLRNVKGKTWEEIIESACTPGGKDLGY